MSATQVTIGPSALEVLDQWIVQKGLPLEHLNGHARSTLRTVVILEMDQRVRDLEAKLERMEAVLIGQAPSPSYPATTAHAPDGRNHPVQADQFNSQPPGPVNPPAGPAKVSPW